jgi:CRP/FNR family transcriptional regulator
MMTPNATLVDRIYAGILEPLLLGELKERSMAFTAAAGQQLIQAGQPIKVVPLMLSGALKVSRVNEDGQELLLYYARAGEGCAMTFSCGMMGQPSQVKGAAEEDLEMLCVPVDVMEEWMRKYESWKKFVMSTIVDEFMDVIRSVDAVTFKRMDERLVDYLKERATLSGSQLINLTHQRIADDLGTNRVVISRLLKRLEEDRRLILYRNEIKLLSAL